MPIHRIITALVAILGVIALAAIGGSLAWARHDPANTAWGLMNFLVVVAYALIAIGYVLAPAMLEDEKSAVAIGLKRGRPIILAMAAIVLVKAIATGFAGGVYPAKAYADRDAVRDIGREYCRLQPVDQEQQRQCYEDLAGESLYWSFERRPMKRFWHPAERQRARLALDERAAAEAKNERDKEAEEARQAQIAYQASLRPDIWRDPETGCEYLVQRGDGTQTYLERKDANGKQICRKVAPKSAAKPELAA